MFTGWFLHSVVHSCDELYLIYIGPRVCNKGLFIISSISICWAYCIQAFISSITFVVHLCYFCLVLFLLCFRVHLFIDPFWSPVGKGLTSWLSFVMSNCEAVTFTLVSWVRCGV